MTSSNAHPVLFLLGVGPGLGMSVARSFGRRGYRVAIASRSADRHPGYLAELRELGIDAAAFEVDATRPGAIADGAAAALEHFGRIDVAYYGAGVPVRPSPITELDAASAVEALGAVGQAVAFARAVLPQVREHRGGLLFVGGLSSIVPMPELGALALVASALRTYALGLHRALEPEGVYAGTLTVGGMIAGGEIAAEVAANAPGQDLSAITLRPDDLAETVWRMLEERSAAETVIDVIS